MEKCSWEVSARHRSRGLSERFDSSIGAASVLMPYGGHFQKTRTDGMAAKLPVRQGDTDTVSFDDTWL